jgi:hypothetical protein
MARDFHAERSLSMAATCEKPPDFRYCCVEDAGAARLCRYQEMCAHVCIAHIKAIRLAFGKDDYARVITACVLGESGMQNKKHVWKCAPACIEIVAGLRDLISKPKEQVNMYRQTLNTRLKRVATVVYSEVCCASTRLRWREEQP